MLSADLRHDFVRGFSGRFSSVSRERAHVLVTEMIGEGFALLGAEGVAAADREAVVAADLRYVGQHHEVMVTCRPQDVDPAETGGFARIEEAFHRRHEQLYGFSNPGKELEILSLRVAVVGRRAVREGPRPEAVVTTPEPKNSRAAYLRSRGEMVDIPVYEGGGLPTDVRVAGPCIVDEPTTTIVVPEYFDIVRRADNYVLVAKEHELTGLGERDGEER
jgi:N-methylhydantoinase A